MHRNVVDAVSMIMLLVILFWLSVLREEVFSDSRLQVRYEGARSLLLIPASVT